MTYICFIECARSSVPHMEPLSADDAGTALEKARRLMAEHSSAIAAHVFDGDERIATLTADYPRSGGLLKRVRTSPAGGRARRAALL